MARLNHKSALALTLAGAAALAGAAHASGPPDVGPWYIDAFGGETADQAAFYRGRLGVVLPAAPRAWLFMDWRLLHGQSVGEAAGKALCCGGLWWRGDGNTAESDIAPWPHAREAVLGPAPAAQAPQAPMDQAAPASANFRDMGDGVELANCQDDAFRTAAATLKDRAGRYGAASAEVRAWLRNQDAVFETCSGHAARLAPLPANAPVWLKADRDYQQAAILLYSGRELDANWRFAAIARDPNSPWRGMGTYLAARAVYRYAMRTREPRALADAKSWILALKTSPAGTYGQGEVEGMRKAIAFRAEPLALRRELNATLARPTLGPTVGEDFDDLVNLEAKATDRGDLVDWIQTIKSADQTRRPGLDHAIARWKAGHDKAWLAAALALADAGDPEAAGLAREAAKVEPASPAYLTVAYHRARLTLASASPQATRALLNPILARKTLSTTDRNLFAAERMQVAETLHAFARDAVRRRLCAETVHCVRETWNDYVEPSGVYDGDGDKGSLGLGSDARWIIDRMSIAQRTQLASDPALPGKLQLDVALTTWARAVQVQDNAAIDKLSLRLKTLLPQLAADWVRLAATAPGPDKRFAEFFVMAKIPGLRSNLSADYVRPEGRVFQFQRHWTPWLMLRGPIPDAAPTSDHYGRDDYVETPQPFDLTCLRYCGAGTFRAHDPAFMRAVAAQAARERGYLHSYDDTLFGGPNDYGYLQPEEFAKAEKGAKAKVAQYGATSPWDEMLGWISAHPKDPRAPEALHWLVHVGHFGGSYNHTGKRAFMLLHHRYEGSYWAERTDSYND